MKKNSKLQFKIQKFLPLFLLFTFYLLPFYSYALNDTDGELKLYLNEPQTISVSNPSRVVIGNPDVLDVSNVTKSEMTLNPKGVGITTLVFWDNFGEQAYKIKVFTEDIFEVKRRIDNLLSKLNLSEVYTQAEEEEARVILLGRVKTAQDRERIALALGPLKEKTVDLVEVKEEEAVVEIDVQVLELNKDATNTLGLTNPLSTTSGYSITETGSPGLTAARGALFNISNLQRSAFSWTLYALVQEGKARILSRPRLACQSGKEAELLVGGEKPILTTEVAAATGAEATNVDYKEYGIKLKIKPTVSQESKIKLALNIEVSEVGTAETIGSSASPTAKAYPLTKRNISTEVFLDDGQTLAIGGLMKQKFEEDITKNPILGDIPILGLLFRKKVSRVGGGAAERGNTELYVTLTPTIVTGKDKLARPEEKKEKEKPSQMGVSSLTEESVPEYLRGYAAVIQKRILDKLTYPVSAKQAGFQGKVTLSLHLSFRGELLDVVAKESSGSKILDENAISVARQLDTYPPFPSSIDQEELWVDVPIVYRLD